MKNNKSPQKEIDGFKVIGIGFIIFFIILYAFIATIWPIYSNFQKEYETEEKLVTALHRHAPDVFYPEELTADLQEAEYRAIMDGRNSFARPEGYEVGGLMQIADRQYKVRFHCQKMDEIQELTNGKFVYRGMECDALEVSNRWELRVGFEKTLYTLTISLPGQQMSELPEQEKEQMRAEGYEMWHQIMDGCLEKQQTKQ